MIRNLILSTVALGVAVANQKSTVFLDGVAPSNLTETDGIFVETYSLLHSLFDYNNYNRMSHDFIEGLEVLEKGVAFKRVDSMPHCDGGEPGRSVTALSSSHVAPFPGGSSRRTYGFDLMKKATEVLSKAKGPASSQSAAASLVGLSAMMLMKNLVQSSVAAAAATVPMGVPPPAWNNQPLPCMPMVTGHNCFGAVTYPITFSDFLLADVTDSSVDGIISSFPDTFAERVGRASDEVYNRCFRAYMSMHCSSIFPMCTNPQGRNEMIPGIGRAPVCFPTCLNVLVDCPGFTVEDLTGPCNEMSVPPLCAMAYFSRDDARPPQSSTFDEANSFPVECPKYDASLDFTRTPGLLDVVSLAKKVA